MFKRNRVLLRWRISTWCLPKEEAIDFVSSIAIDAQKSGEKVAAQAASMLLQAIDKSYVQLPKVVEIEIVIIVL